jgi:hypothetical protein
MNGLMAKSDNFIVVLDGITVQHAGELLFDCGDSSQRRLSRHTYIRCLEDFTFAILMGEGFALAGTLPKVGTEHPGAILLEEIKSFDDKLRYDLGYSSQFTPLDILSHPEYREKIYNGLLCTHQSYNRGKQNKRFWMDFLRREISSYMGKHESLCDSRIPTEQIIFAHETPYLQDSFLQSSIKRESFLDELSSLLHTELKLSNANVREEALTEFITRVILSHITRFWWYESIRNGSGFKNNLGLPYVIRSLVRQMELKEQGLPGSVKRKTQHFKTIVTRLALADVILSAPVQRHEIIDHLMHLRCTEFYEDIRKLWTDLVNEINLRTKNNKFDMIKSIISDISRGSRSSHVVDEVDIDNNRVFDSSSHGSLRALRKLAYYRNIGPYEEYLKILNKVFPELDENHSQKVRVNNISIVNGNYNEMAIKEENQMSGDRNISISSGNYIESNPGTYVQGDYVNMSQDLTQAAIQLQDLITQLQKQGMSADSAKTQIVNDILTQAQQNSTIKNKLIKWGESLTSTTISDVVKGTVKLAIRTAGLPLP